MSDARQAFQREILALTYCRVSPSETNQGRHLLFTSGNVQLANRLRTAIDQVLRKDGVRTPDMGGKASADDFTQSNIRRL
jgi:hypothetical protein